MSKVIPGIRGVPFRKIVERGPYQGAYILERLSCGHRNIVLAGLSCGNTKRRCYYCPKKKHK